MEGTRAEILRASAPDGQLIGLDWDEEAIAASRERLSEFGARVQLVRANFVELDRVLMSLGVTTVDGILFDLGVSSRQFDEPSRGFSFLREGALDMRMSRQIEASARDVLRTASLEELARIFRIYGEERRARAIARGIVEEREHHPMETTTQLARLVERVARPEARLNASCDARVSSATDLREQRTGESQARLGKRREPFEVGRAHCRHFISFAGGPHREAVFRADEHGMRLSTRVGRLRLWSEKKCCAS